MESLRLERGVDRSSAQRVFPLGADPQRSSADSAASDLELARLTKVNVFVVGADDAVAKLVTSLWRCFVTPIVVRHRGEPLRLPASQPVGTIVVYDVDTLMAEEQHALNRWVCARSGTRIVSTASASLLPMVDAGAFDDALYYRLNVVTIDLASPIAG